MFDLSMLSARAGGASVDQILAALDAIPGSEKLGLEKLTLAQSFAARGHGPEKTAQLIMRAVRARDFRKEVRPGESVDTALANIGAADWASDVSTRDLMFPNHDRTIRKALESRFPTVNYAAIRERFPKWAKKNHPDSRRYAAAVREARFELAELVWTVAQLVTDVEWEVGGGTAFRNAPTKRQTRALSAKPKVAVKPDPARPVFTTSGETTVSDSGVDVNPAMLDYAIRGGKNPYEFDPKGVFIPPTATVDMTDNTSGMNRSRAPLAFECWRCFAAIGPFNREPVTEATDIYSFGWDRDRDK